mgnify:CR=1 FL=1
MDVAYINPFIEGIDLLFSNMLDTKAQRGKLSLASCTNGGTDVTAIIGMSGPARGTVALGFPVSTALAMASRLLDEDIKTMNPDVTDAMAEMVNIVAGSAKSKLSKGDQPIDLGLPSIVRGADLELEQPRGSRWIEVPFTTEFGKFYMRVAFERGTEAQS